MFDGEAFGQQMVEIVRGYVDAELAPLKAANEALAARLADLEELAKKSPDIDLTGVEKLIEDEIAKLPPVPQEIDTEELLEPLLSRIAELEQRKPDVEPIVAEAVAAAVAALPTPEDGKSITVEDVAPLIASEVEKAVASLPKPKDGEPGKDAANIVEALKDSGELVLTLQDGRLIRTGIRDGEPGQNGFELDDFTIEPGEDGRTYTLKFERGEIRHTYELSFPCPVYCGVWKEGETYVPGDLVTWAGSTWHCNKAEPGKPETKDSGWQLMVKKGRDGKDVKSA